MVLQTFTQMLDLTSQNKFCGFNVVDFHMPLVFGEEFILVLPISVADFPWL